MLRANNRPVKMNELCSQSWPGKCKKNEKNPASVEIELGAEYNVRAAKGQVDRGLSRQYSAQGCPAGPLHRRRVEQHCQGLADRPGEGRPGLSGHLRDGHVQ